MPKQDEYVQEFVENLNAEFHRRLQKKTGWEKDEVYQEYLQALAVAAIHTASSMLKAIEGVFADERVAD